MNGEVVLGSFHTPCVTLTIDSNAGVNTQAASICNGPEQKTDFYYVHMCYCSVEYC